MLVRRLNPTYVFPELRRDMDRVFNHFFGDWDVSPLRRTPAFPAVNVWEDGECFFAEAEVPGVSMNDLEILTVGDELTLKGRRRTPDGQNVNYHRQERGTGEFARVITLPTEVNTDKVEATLKDGVLTIVMPKAEAARARKIQVKAQ